MRYTPKVDSALLLLLACFACGGPAGRQPGYAVPSPPAADDIVATVAGIPITAREMRNEVGMRDAAMQAQLYRVQRAALESMVARRLIEAEAARQGVAVDRLTQTETNKRMATVTTEEARAVYESAKDRFAGKAEEDAIASIAESMRQSRIQSARTKWISELRKASDVVVRLEPPRARVESGPNPPAGPTDAPVSIVVFSDYECAFCGRHAATLKRLESKFGKSISIAVRDFPLPIHKRAAKAAEAAACASDQGRFWEMHDWLFANQRSLDPSDFKKAAVTLGLDASRFAQCLDAGKFAAGVEKERRAGERLGVAGTPATFVNGQLIPGAMAFEEYASVVEDELQRHTRAPVTGHGRQ